MGDDGARRQEDFTSFGGRDGARGGGGNRHMRERASWKPGQGRNPDLEAERLTGHPLARDYSEHDDRRASTAEAADQGFRRRASSPGGKWKHDLHDLFAAG